MRITLVTAGLVVLTSSWASAQSPAPQTPGTDSAAKANAWPPQKPYPACDLYNFSTDKNEGRLGAKKEQSWAWFAGGFGLGLVTPLVGPVALMIVAQRGNPHPKAVPTEWNPPCYDMGFRNQKKAQHVVNAFLGGIAGTAFGLILVTVAGVDDSIVFPLVPGDVGNDRLIGPSLP